MSAALANAVGAHAVGALAAQRFIDELRNDQAVPDEALERLQQIQIEHGVESPAVRAFLGELAKRCR
jgi:hypothetical protein